MKILVPVDGSKFSKAAVDFIASRTTLIGGSPEVELLNVQLPIPTRAARVVGKDVVKSYYEEESQRVLKPALAALNKIDTVPPEERGGIESVRHALAAQGYEVLSLIHI
ncbi:MAG: universal stress protein, partial [Burkholderiaceae bacterium]|nr:universal stress protein [Burkholderiaceae bacterium]